MGLKAKIVQWVARRIRLPLAGIDISDRSIKYARFVVLPRRLISSRRSRVVLADCGEEEIPEGAVARGAVEREDILASALGAMAARAGRAFCASGMVVSLPEEKSFLKLIQTPRVTEDAMAGAVRWGIEGQIPLAPEGMIYDFEQIRPPDPVDQSDHRDSVVTAFPKTIVAPYVRALKAAGLTPAALELESQAIIRAVVRDCASSEAKIVLDVGRTRTSFIIVAGGAIVFTATIGIGGQALEQNIVQGLGVDEVEAMRIKKEIGLSKTSHDGKLYAALAPSLSAVADELRRTVAYYRDHVTHAHGAGGAIERVLLSGGDASLYGLDTYLAVASRIPVSVADPFAALGARGGDAMPRHQALAFTAAIGLALRGIRQGEPLH